MSDSNQLRGAAAIVGIGATEFSKESGRSELRLAVEACELAIADAGLEPAQIDGMVTYTQDTNPEIEIARNLGVGSCRSSRASTTAAVPPAAPSTGGAGRSRSRRRLRRLLPGVQRGGRAAFRRWCPGPPAGGDGRAGPLRLVRAVRTAHAGPVGGDVRDALHARVRRDERGLRARGRRRPHARTNPRLGSTRSRSRSRSSNRAGSSSRCTCSTAARERRRPGDRRHVSRAARDLSHPAAIINSAAQGAGENQDMMTSYYRDSITGLPEMGLVARQLWNTTGLGPDDIQTAVIYDHFTPLVLPQLEEFGFPRRARPRSSCATATSSSAVASRSTRTGGSSVRRTSTA